MKYNPVAPVIILLSTTFLATAQNAFEKTPLLKRTPAEYAAAVEQALSNEQPDQAYLNARAWQRSAPGEIPPLTAMAGAYLDFGAPAAALQTLEYALALGPDAAEVRRIEALKIQALLEAGDYSAAWANVREYLRTAAPEDPFVPILAELQWTAFGGAVAAGPMAAVYERSGSIEIPLTAARIDAEYRALLTDRLSAFRQAQKSKDPEAVSSAADALIRFLWLAHYRPDPSRSGQFFTPLNDAPDTKQALKDLSYAEHAARAVALLEWAPVQESYNEQKRRKALENYLPEPPDVMPDPEIKAFLLEAPNKWAELEAAAQPLLEKADAAVTEPELIESIDELMTLKNTQLFPLQAQARNHALVLKVWLEYLDAEPEEYPLYQEIRAFEKQLAAAEIFREIDRRLEPALTGNDALSLPRRLAMVYFDAEQAFADAPLENIASSDAPALEDFDPLILQNRMTSNLWKKRRAAAEALQDWQEIAWSGFEAEAEQPEKQRTWIEPLIAENDAVIDESLAGMKNGSTEEKAAAVLDLQEALRRDPTHLTGLSALYRHFLEAEQDDFAAGVLEQLWRLCPSGFSVDDDGLALSARVGNWPLLLSLCDHRLLRSETDIQALLHRQVAALALNLNGLTLDATPAFNGTVYSDQSRLLHAMALTLQLMDYKAFTGPLTGLQPVVKQLNAGEGDDTLRLWIALGLKLKPEVFRFDDLSFETLAAGATPALQQHLNFIQGKTEAESYLAAMRNTEDEATAQFLYHFLAGQQPGDPQHLAALGGLSGHRDLPLYFRAKAAGLAAAGNDPAIPLRISDPFYTPWNLKNWNAVWSALAPGQQLMALGSVELPEDTTPLPVLRISKPPRNRMTYLSGTTPFHSRLWELDGVSVSSSHPTAKVWTLEEGGVAAISRGLVEGRTFRGKGSVWIEASDVVGAGGSAAGLYLVDVQSRDSSFDLYGSFEADQLVSAQSRFRFVDDGSTGGRVSRSVFATDHADLFKLQPATALAIDDCRIFASVELDPDLGKIAFRNSSLSGAAQPKLSVSAGLNVTALNLEGPADYTVSNATEFHDALAAVQPGGRIDLAPGTILLEKAVQVPEGIIIRGSADAENPSTLTVPNASKINPVITTSAGDLWLENLTLSVETAVRDGRFKIADSLGNRKALRAAPGSRLFLRNVEFASWDHRNSFGRNAIVADNAQVFFTEQVPGSLQVANGGRIDFIQGKYATGPISLSGRGRIYGNHTSGSELLVSGTGLRFHGGSLDPKKMSYTDGAGDPRTLAWRTLARDNVNSILDELSRQLPDQLNRAADQDARIELFKAAAQRISPPLAAAQLKPADAARLISRSLNPVLTRRPEETPYYFEALYVRRPHLPSTVYRAHFQMLDKSIQQQIKAYFTALSGSLDRRGSDEFSAGERSALASFMSKYPVGHAQHARAIAAFSRGDTLYEFQSRLAEEEKQRRIRAKYEARLAAQRAQAAEAARQAAMYQPPPKPRPWWNSGNYNAGYTPQQPYTSKYISKQKPYRGSADQQLRNYKNQLNKKIYNRGRDYGRQNYY
ncbi:hypothetical protein [Pontiella agarivorans]|uniref:Uncharacterized protein n=1 Tax=Pontiella agarivorans TaxID=3038953 RepID=A0ABU5MWH4_9BACT|nr:hypothetical protein [Pontiella agarivorans]MDZ8118533.1 hypothetical protein [Pontiella agarivorans]